MAAEPAVTARVAAALVSPAALTVIVALPTVAGVKLNAATPFVTVNGEEGLKVPDTPDAASEIAALAVVTVLPFASWIVAV